MLTAIPVRGVAGIARIPVPSPTLPPAETTNCWVLGNSRVVVVDPAGVTEQTRQGLFDALVGRTIEAIFLTHHHGDHIGGAADLRKRTGAPVLSHAHTARQVPFPVDRIVDEGDQIACDSSTWTALHTPGHARGHICLESADGETVVAGDMVAGEGTIVLDPPEGDLGQYLASLERLHERGPLRLLPAHGPAIAPARPLLQHYLQHRRKRTEQIGRALASVGSSDPAGLVRVVYPDLPAPFHPIAARQILCHLLWLAARGEAERDETRFWITGGAA